MSEAKRTTDHQTIRHWAEARDARPAIIRTPGEDGGILRFDQGEPDQDLEKIGWDEFFRVFEQNELALLYQDDTASGDQSRFAKFVSR